RCGSDKEHLAATWAGRNPQGCPLPPAPVHRLRSRDRETRGGLMARTAEDTRRLRPDRVPPHNLEAEESVLGSMMLSAEAIAEVIEEIKPEDFYRSSHHAVYDALIHLYGRGEP